MEIIKPTPIKFEGDLKKAIQAYANKKELGNFSAVVKKAVIKHIKYKFSGKPVR